MKNRKILALFGASVITLSLQGCLPTIAIPDQKPITEGILNSPAPDSPSTKVATGPNISMAVILSENTKKNIIYLKKRQDIALNGGALSHLNRVAYAESANPDFIIQWLSSSLKRNFGNLKFYETSTEARAHGADYFGILDIYWVNAADAFNNRDYDARISLQFFDGKFRYIGTASGKSVYQTSWANLSYPTYAEIIRSIQVGTQTRVQALQKLDLSMSQLFIASQHPTTGPADSNYDVCMRSALKTTDKSLKIQAMNACNAVQ